MRARRLTIVSRTDGLDDFQVSARGDVSLRFFDLLERDVGMLAQSLAESRGKHPTTGALEERAAETSLEIRELMTQRRLCEIEPTPGAREIAQLGDGGHEA